MMASMDNNKDAANQDQCPTHDQPLATHDNQHTTHLIATEGQQNSSSCNGGNELPTDSIQLPNLLTVPPIMDTFEELDMNKIDTSPIKSTLSAPLVTDSAPVAEIPPIQLDEHRDQIVEVESVPPTIQSVPSGDNTTEHVNDEMENTPESSSSTESLEITPPRTRRHIRRKVSFAERLEPFENTASMPRPRRYFDLFSFSCRKIWNKTIQDVQSQLIVMLKRQKLEDEAPMLRVALSDQRIDSSSQKAAMNVTERSDLEANIEVDAKAPNNQSMPQLNDLKDQLGSIDEKMVEVSDGLEATAEFKASDQNENFCNERNLESEDTPNNMAPLDAMITHVLVVVQGEMCNNGEQIENWISIQRLQELLHARTRLEGSKLFKNLILLKQAGLLDIKLNAEHRITGVSMKLPSIDDGGGVP